MSTTETVLLYIITILLGLMMLFFVTLMVVLIKLMLSVRQVVRKAEGVLDSVESAAEVFRDAQGPLAAIKIIKNIVKLSNKARKGKS